MVTDFQIRGSLFPSLSPAGLDALFRGFLAACDQPVTKAERQSSMIGRPFATEAVWDARTGQPDSKSFFDKQAVNSAERTHLEAFCLIDLNFVDQVISI